MVSMDPEQVALAIPRKHRVIVASSARVLPALRLVGCVLPPARRRLAAYYRRLFEKYASEAYLYDTDDVGMFETFILQEGAVDEILDNYEKRSATMKKSVLLNRIAGQRPRGRDQQFDAANAKLSLDEKKKAALLVVRDEGKVIQFFGKRLEKREPRFYAQVERLCRCLLVERSPGE